MMLSPTSSPMTKSKRSPKPARPPRKTSLTRADDMAQMNTKMDKGDGDEIQLRDTNRNFYLNTNFFTGKIHRSTSELDLNRYDMNHDMSKDDKKKRGRSPFK